MMPSRTHTPNRALPQEVLLLENDINTSPFTPAVHECVPPLPWAVTDADTSDPHRCVGWVDGSTHATSRASSRLRVVTHAMSTPPPPPLAPRRQDLRHLCVCSVDPPGCKDIDDALHMR